MKPIDHERLLRIGGKPAALWLLILFAVVGLTRTPDAFGQAAGPSGSLSGVVQDINDAIVPGVTVTVKNAGTGLTRTVTSDEEGRWTVPALPVGVYQVTYEREGFKTLISENVQVEAAVPRTIEAKMEAGGVAETVTVTEGAAALATPDTSTTFSRIDAEELVQVPT
ncbi:MAG: carboxypeptidase-like regulatory domain-containing protein [Pyrinomonadaceae bacterium]